MEKFNDESNRNHSIVVSDPTIAKNLHEDEHKKGGKKKKKNRCLCCKKKIGLTGVTCRCGNLFCPIHRYSEKHNCTIDYKELGAEVIRKNNPMVIASKVSKI